MGFALGLGTNTGDTRTKKGGGSRGEPGLGRLLKHTSKSSPAQEEKTTKGMPLTIYLRSHLLSGEQNEWKIPLL